MTYADDGGHDGIGDDLQELRIIDVSGNVDRVDDLQRQVVEVAGENLDGQQYEHRQPVEDVQHGGAGERPPELLLVGHLTHRHDRVSH